MWDEYVHGQTIKRCTYTYKYTYKNLFTAIPKSTQKRSLEIRPTVSNAVTVNSKLFMLAHFPYLSLYPAHFPAESSKKVST